MLTFIIKNVYPDFECKNLSQNVMQIMGSLNYPYNIKESHFKPVGSPHSWPHLLQLLSWLCDMMKFFDYELNNMSQLLTLDCKDEEADNELNHILMRRELYVEHDKGSSTLEEINENYTNHLNLKKRIKSLQSEEQLFQQKIEEFKEKNLTHGEFEENFLTKNEAARQKINELIQDRSHFDALIDKLQESIDSLQNDHNDKIEKSSCLENEIDELVAVNKKLTASVGEQPPSAEVMKVKQYLNNLKEEVS